MISLDVVGVGARTVLLVHTLVDGTAHFDWLLDARPADHALPQADDRTLIAFRIRQRIDEVRGGDSADAERLPEHRRRYLEYEGPISDDRGHVSRVASGVITSVSGSDGLTIDIAWNVIGSHPHEQRSFTQSIALTHVRGDSWRARCVRSNRAAQ